MIRRRYGENDSFFYEGDMARLLFQSKAVSVHDSVDAKPKSDVSDGEDSMMLEDTVPEKTYRCTQINCQASFSDFDSFDYHVNNAHIHRCIVCHRDFHNSRLLDIHMTEKHDSYFQVLSKREPAYVCLVEGCGLKFNDDWERRKHLQHVHKYPMSYNFHNPSYFKKSVVKKSKEKEKQKERVKLESDQREGLQEQESIIIEMTSNSDSGIDVGKENNNKEKGVEITRKWNKEKDKSKEKEEGGMDIDELTSGMVRMRIPKNITFGGRGRGGKRRGKMF